MASTPNVVQDDIAWVRCGPERKSFSAAPKVHPHRAKAHITLNTLPARTRSTIAPKSPPTHHPMRNPMSCFVDPGTCCAVPKVMPNKTLGRFGLNPKSCNITPMLFCIESNCDILGCVEHTLRNMPNIDLRITSLLVCRECGHFAECV